MTSSPTGRVVVIGSANIDIIARVDHLPAPGETVLGDRAAFRPGGKGANQAVAARRLGADTLFYAALGADAFGHQMRDTLHGEGVALDHLIEIEAAPTGIAMIVVAADGENSIVVASGANSALDPSAVADLRSVLVPGDVVLLQLEIPLDTCVAAAGAARAAGACVVLNAAPTPKPGDPHLPVLLRSVDVLVVNETEAATLAGRVPPVTMHGWTAIAADLLRLGPAAAVVTLGADGAAAAMKATKPATAAVPVATAVPAGATTASVTATMSATVAIDVPVAEAPAAMGVPVEAAPGDGGGATTERDVTWLQPAYPADVVDTTGAGDAFCGALAALLTRGADLATAVRAGAAAGALATGRLGAQAALPSRQAVERLVNGEA